MAAVLGSASVEIEDARWLLGDENRSPSLFGSGSFAHPFDPRTEHLNFGFSNRDLWIAFTLRNPSARAEKIRLTVDNPLLETVELLCEGNVSRTGLLYDDPRRWLTPAFALTLPADSSRPCILHLHNQATTLQTGIAAVDPKTHERHDTLLHHSVLFFGGILLEYGAGIAGGCTSGLAISGGVQLAPAAFLFIAGMFASGIITAMILYGKRY